MAVQYGVTRDYVLGFEVVLPTGELIEAGTRTMKGVVGYDLTRLFLGSEGTLGVITRIILKLVAKPQARQTLAAGFGTLAAAARTVTPILTLGWPPPPWSSWTTSTLGVRPGAAALSGAGQAAALLLIAVDGHPQDVEARAAALVRFCGNKAPARSSGPRPGRGRAAVAGPQGHLPGAPQSEAPEGERGRGGAPGRHPRLNRAA